MRFDGPQKVAPQQRLHIREGMTVEEIKKYGSDGQKLAASLFDSEMVKNENGNHVKDGVFTKEEAVKFNNYNFTVKNNIFTMYDRKSGQTTEIKFNDINDLKELLNGRWNKPNSMYLRKDGKLLNLAEATKGGKITLDLTNMTIVADGVEGRFFTASGEKVTIKNSNLKRVSTAHARELEIENTKDKGVLYDSATKVNASKDTIVKTDEKSDINLDRRF